MGKKIKILIHHSLKKQSNLLILVQDQDTKLLHKK